MDMDMGADLGVFGGPQVLGSIPVEQIRAVEQVDKGTFQHPHVLQVVAQDGTGQLHTTYLQCKVGDPTVPQHPINPRNPPPQHPGIPPPSPAPAAGQWEWSQIQLYPGTLCTESTGSTEVKGLTACTGEVGVSYPGSAGVTGPHLPSLLLRSFVTKLSLLSPSPVPWGVPLSLVSPQSAPELWQWLWALRRATSANRDMLPTCHPGTFRAGRWTCCQQPTRTVPGCSRTHGAVALGEWSDLGDPAVAAQSLYGHLR
ncbi:hypothetical protein DV515_00017286 [Chloebia gouldiae]|uniref:Uncharacterized protein n=1 Tax=Chloebia gouldiae TaxID=44316 RepID=A0A3L8R0C2_CHLGU|nr:hypothetical protein DV515_00017285 [Chloebia gouldiae]RLV73060.1 hypothetical protein DV515_00017286 [Chloebia gouldiae]